MPIFSQFHCTVPELNLKGNFRGDIQIFNVFGRVVKQEWVHCTQKAEHV